MFFSDNGEIEKEGIKSAAAISLFNLLFYIPKNKETALYKMEPVNRTPEKKTKK